MKNKVNLPIPVLRALRKLGADLSDARRRHRITIQLIAERAGVSRITIGKIEKGDATVSMGAYSAVLFVLGMTERLADLADTVHDLIGHQLMDEKLPQRVRLPKNKSSDDRH